MMFVLKKTYDAKVAELKAVTLSHNHWLSTANNLTAELDDARNNMALYRDDRDDWRDKHNSVTAKFKKAVTDLAELDVSPWEFHCGEPPDYDSPLLRVYDAGILYAYQRLADRLGVEDFQTGDGSEDYATDVGQTGVNVLVEAGFVNDDGDLLTPVELAALKADALAMRRKRQMDRDRRKKS